MTNKTLNEAWEFFKTNFKWLLVATLFVFFYMDGCVEKIVPQQPTVIRDTIWVKSEYQSPVYVPPVINVIPSKPDIINTPPYKPDTSYMGLLRQYEKLVKDLTSKNVYDDTLRLDSIGYVNVKDTISNNKIENRSYNYKYLIPKETITIREPYKPKNQVFGGVDVNLPHFSDVGIGVFLKNKKDNMLGVVPNYNFQQARGGVRISYYKLLKLSRK